MSEPVQQRLDAMAAERDRARTDMAAIGIDEAFIDRLVETFYGRVLAHPELGPVFDARLAGRWPEHMARMKIFWSAVAFRNGAYSGRPVAAHQSVSGLTPDLFGTWLTLFAAVLDEIAPSPEAAASFKATAERIAKSLTLSLFYNPAIDDPSLRRA